VDERRVEERLGEERRFSDFLGECFGDEERRVDRRGEP